MTAATQPPRAGAPPGGLEARAPGNTLPPTTATSAEAGVASAIRPRSDLATAIRDAASAALITLGLSIPLLALKTEQGSGGLILEQRWGLVAICCGIVFLGRLALRLLGLRAIPSRRSSAAARGAVTTKAEPEARSRVTLSAVLSPLFLGIALAFPVLAYLGTGGLGESRYWVDLGILILTYVMLGWGLNIVVGLAGLLDLGYVAFYAVGAYSYALLATTFSLSFWVCLPLAGILAAFWGILLGFPVLRLRGDYLAIVTLAFGEIIRLVLINWVDVTGGGAGISSIPRVTFFGIPFSDDPEGFIGWLRWATGWGDGVEGRFVWLFGPEGPIFSAMHRILFLYYLILALALLTNLVTLRLRRLPIGRAWEALREDEIACRSLGINTTTTKLTAFAIGAMFGGFAGSFFAVRQGFISPESFNFLESATILAIVVLGGMGSQIGVAVAAIAMVGGPEMLRNLGFLKQVFGPGFDPNEYRLLLFGMAMVLMMIWRPRGLISVREPSVVLRERRSIAGSFVKEGHG